MKKLCSFAATLCIGLTASAQAINFPDANFKSYLLTYPTIDTDGDFFADANADANGDGEIDLTEALAITQVNAGNQNIASLGGLEFFTNLIDLYFENNQVTSVDLHTLSHLKHIRCTGNLLTSIDLCGTSATSLWAESNPNLSFISVKNSVISTYEIMRPTTVSGPPPLPSFMFDPTALQTVCYDEGELLALEQVQNIPGILLTTDCVSSCTASPNIITGNIKFDFNNNGCDASDTNGGFPIKVSHTGQPDFTFYSGSGSYTFYTFQDDLTLTPQLGNPYYTVDPSSATTTYTGTGNNETINFCVTPNGTFPDLSIDFAQGGDPRPGFDTTYFLYYKNKGTQPLSGQITVNFDDARLDFLGANPPVATQSNGVLMWNFNAIAPFETRYISFIMNVNSPSDVPPVNVGDMLDFFADITPAAATDINPVNNADTLTQIVHGSSDPNDLSVSKLMSHIEPPLEYLNYTVRFQNTGNEPAEKVVVTDRLDERFDANSLEIVGGSHAFRTVLNADHTIEFTFEGINLPPSATDESASHGYVTFKIKPIDGSVDEGDTISNQADIYFDFNLPVSTNAVSTAYFAALGKSNFEKDSFFTLYPNPVKNRFSISYAEPAAIESLSIYNTLGQLVQRIPSTSEKTISIDATQLKTGTYFIEIISDKGKTTKKFIKL